MVLPVSICPWYVQNSNEYRILNEAVYGIKIWQQSVLIGSMLLQLTCSKTIQSSEDKLAQQGKVCPVHRGKHLNEPIKFLVWISGSIFSQKCKTEVSLTMEIHLFWCLNICFWYSPCCRKIVSHTFELWVDTLFCPGAIASSKASHIFKPCDMGCKHGGEASKMWLPGLVSSCLQCNTKKGQKHAALSAPLSLSPWQRKLASRWLKFVHQLTIFAKEHWIYWIFFLVNNNAPQATLAEAEKELDEALVAFPLSEVVMHVPHIPEAWTVTTSMVNTIDAVE